MTPLFSADIKVDAHYIKKNNRPLFKNNNGRLFLGKSAKLKQGERYLTDMVKLHYAGRTPISCDVALRCLFFYSPKDYFRKDGIRKKTIGDLSNHYQLVEDCLQAAGVIIDDRQIQSHDGSRILPNGETSLRIVLTRFAEVDITLQ